MNNPTYGCAHSAWHAIQTQFTHPACSVALMYVNATMIKLAAYNTQDMLATQEPLNHTAERCASATCIACRLCNRYAQMLASVPEAVTTSARHYEHPQKPVSTSVLHPALNADNCIGLHHAQRVER